MRKRTTESAFEEIRMFSVDEGTRYTGLGKSTFRRWAEEIGAVKRIGSRVLYDRTIIDKAIDNLGK